MRKIIGLEIRLFIRRHFGIFLVSAIAFSLSCIAISITLTNYLSAKSNQQMIEESYGDKYYYKVMLNGDEEVFSNFFSGKNAAAIKDIFDQLKADGLFDYHYAAEYGIQFYDESDASYSQQDFPRYPPECTEGYETGEPLVRDDYLCLKGIYADRIFPEIKTVQLEEGTWFSDSDFYVDSKDEIVLPVVLGSAYRGMYQIGDLLTDAHIVGEDTDTLRVVGFLSEGSYFYDNNDEKIVLNRYMVVPGMETSEIYDASVADVTNDSLFRQVYDSMKLMNARVSCRKEDARQVSARIYEIFRENGLYELRLTDETDSNEKALAEARDLTMSCAAVSIFIILFGVVVFCVQSRYKLLQYRRKYSIFILNGVTKKQLFFLAIADTFCIFVLADVIFACFWVWNGTLGYDGLDLTDVIFLLVPALELAILFFMGIFAATGTARLDMSAALRENE